MPKSSIPEHVIAAYRLASYQAGSGRDAITLRIDQYSEPLSRLFNTSGHRCAAFITACNPFSARDSPEANMRACATLRGRLTGYAAQPGQIIEGMGIDPSGEWPAEMSFLVIGLNLEASWTLGVEFGQNAIVWVGADAIPRLIFLC